MPLLTEAAIRAALVENGIRIHDDSVLLIDHYGKLADSFIRAYLKRQPATWTAETHGQMVAEAIGKEGQP